GDLDEKLGTGPNDDTESSSSSTVPSGASSRAGRSRTISNPPQSSDALSSSAVGSFNSVAAESWQGQSLLSRLPSPPSAVDNNHGAASTTTTNQQEEENAAQLRNVATPALYDSRAEDEQPLAPAEGLVAEQQARHRREKLAREKNLLRNRMFRDFTTQIPVQAADYISVADFAQAFGVSNEQAFLTIYRAALERCAEPGRHDGGSDSACCSERTHPGTTSTKKACPAHQPPCVFARRNDVYRKAVRDLFQQKLRSDQSANIHLDVDARRRTRKAKLWNSQATTSTSRPEQHERRPVETTPGSRLGVVEKDAPRRRKKNKQERVLELMKQRL
ncbi:unnamed protein product, partial [Amoebophrya sp. A120]